MPIHHIELWVPAGGDALDDWRWLLARLGFHVRTEWEGGMSWESAGVYLVLTTSPRLTSPVHDRRSVGMNHIAFAVAERVDVDALVESAPERGWRPLYAERYPHAGGPEHYAAWFENEAGFKVEVVATEGFPAMSGEQRNP